MWDGQDFDTAEDRDEERRDNISVSGCQGLPVAVMVVKGHRDRRQTGGGGGKKPDIFFKSLPKIIVTTFGNYCGHFGQIFFTHR